MPSLTWLTDVIHDRLPKDKVPWLSWGWFKSEYEDPWMFPCHANGMREAAAVSDWVAKIIKPKTVGIMYLNVSEDIAAKDVATKALAKHNIKVVETVAQEWDSPDESQHVLAMRTANPDFILSFSWPAPVAKFMHDANAQKWAPKLGYGANHLTGDPGYGPIFGDYIKDKTYTITSWGIPTAPDPENAEGGNTAEQKLLMDELLQDQRPGVPGLQVALRRLPPHHPVRLGLHPDPGQGGGRARRRPDPGGLQECPGVQGLGFRPRRHAATGRPGQPQRQPVLLQPGVHLQVGQRTRTAAGTRSGSCPDPVFDCAGGNIPAEAKTVCNS